MGGVGKNQPKILSQASELEAKEWRNQIKFH